MKRKSDTLTKFEQDLVESAFADISRNVLPADWKCGESYSNAAIYSSISGLLAIVEVEMNGTDRWIHVSFSRRDRLPTYEEMSLIKDLFIGRDRKAIQILPPKSEHYNFHANCLHMYSPIDRDPLPDFREASGAI